tara:strand:+ start:2461 stop:3966 length:1506 start_codon:yes stop_codon:yes gene_type:complete
LLFRENAEEIGLPLTRAEAAHYLAQASGKRVGIPEPKRGGAKLDVSPVPWLWEGVIMQGRQNLLVAPPKIGKSALMVALASASIGGRQEFLNLPIRRHINHLIIVGTDQNVSDWWTLLEREGLGTKSIDPFGNAVHELHEKVIFWSLEDNVQLNDAGIEAIGKCASENPGSLILVDTYHACIGQLGIEESSSDFDLPARQLEVMLSGTGSTTVLIHHTNKSVSGGNAISASRGNNSLSGAVSWSVLLNWLCPPPEGQMQTDHRIACKPMGRSKATSLVLELTDDGWRSHGDGEDVIAIENLAEVEMNLQGRQGDVYDHVVKLWENQVHTTSSEVSSQFNISQQKALRTLRGLQKKGLLLEDDSMKVDLQGRPASLFKPRKEGTQESGGEKGERGESSSLAHKKDSLTPLTPYNKTPLTPKTPESLGGVNEPKVSIPIRTPVQKLTAGVWKNGYLIRDGSNPHAIVVEKIGNSKVTISNLRWNIDVRECVGSIFGSEDDYEF